MLKKLSVILISIILMISLCGISNAATLKTSLEVIQKASETKYLENDQGFISKTIVDSDSEKGEVTIELKVSNTKKTTEETTKLGTEIILVVDNSPSMDFVTASGKTRKEIILDSAKELVNSIFNLSSTIKVGLVDFHGVGGLLSSSGDAYAGTVNAKLRQELTTDKSAVLAAINEQKERKTESGTNIDAGLKVAQKSFSKDDTNKIIILLTDGIPTCDATGMFGTEAGNDVTTEKSIEVQNNTKATIKSLKDSGYYVITMLTGLDASDGNTDKDGKVYSDDNTLEEQMVAVERIFGTQTNPTANKYYLVKSADLNKVITTDILADVTNTIQNPISSAKIVDYFPDDIMDNFEFSYVGTTNMGTATDSIDKATKSITWDIGQLKGNEVASLKYKLKIKDMQNSALLNKTIATNQKVVLTYNDKDNKSYTVELTSSPKIQLTEVKEETTNPANTTGDNSIATKKIPQTGEGITLTLAIVGIASILGVAFVQYRKNKNI